MVRPWEEEDVPRGDIPNYLVQAILVTICCCPAFGIVAIVYAAQVNGKMAAGDYAGARAASDSAKMWCWIAFGVGIVTNVIGGVAQIGLMQGANRFGH